MRRCSTRKQRRELGLDRGGDAGPCRRAAGRLSAGFLHNGGCLMEADIRGLHEAAPVMRTSAARPQANRGPGCGRVPGLGLRAARGPE